MIRVATFTSFQSGINELQQRQRNLAEAQQQLTSGKRVLRASDDPTAAARAERALATVERSQTDLRSLEASRNAMTLAEAALGDASSLLQEARVTLVAAGNGAYSPTERSTLATRLRDLREQLLKVANRGDGAGTFLFGGQGSVTEPFVDGNTGVEYSGNAGEQVVASETLLPLTVDGRYAWTQAQTGNGVFQTRAGAQQPSSTAWIDQGQLKDLTAVTGLDYQVTFNVTGNAVTYNIDTVDFTTVPPTVLGNKVTGATYVAGQAIEVDGMQFTIQGKPQNGDTFDIVPSEPTLNVFDVIDTAITQLQDKTQTPSEVAQTIAFSLRDIDSSMVRLESVRARVGSVLNNLDQSESRILDLKLYGQKERSAAEDLDMLNGISEFQNQQTGYDAALRTYSTVQRLSLFDYLNR